MYTIYMYMSVCMYIYIKYIRSTKIAFVVLVFFLSKRVVQSDQRKITN